MLDISKQLAEFNIETGALAGAQVTKRYLTDLRGCFNDTEAYEVAVARDNALVYTVASMEPASGEGDLHYGLGTIYPGMVGDEYFLTKGHLHSWRAAAEVYIGLAGQGVMLLQNESGSESRIVPLRGNSVVYVPGHTAHRTMNVGDAPLVYFGVFSARAGHDYSSITERNFQSIVVSRGGEPHLVPRNRK